MKSLFRFVLLLALSAAGLMACPPPVNLPDGGDDNALVVGPEGGLFIRNGYAIDVPAGAVAQQTNIFITALDAGIPEIPDRKRISFGYRFSPTNLRFSTPVKIYLPWIDGWLVKGVDPGTYDMRRQSGTDSFLNPMPGSRTNTVPFEAVEAPTDRLGLFWVTSPRTPNIDRLEIEPETATLRVGEMQAFTARVVAPNGDTLDDVPVVWSVRPARVARIDTSGTLTALDPGVAVVTATAGSKSDTARVTVIREPAIPGPVTAAHENPFPTGNDLWSGALAPAGLGTIFVGENGTVLARSASNQWQRLFSAPGASLRAVGGATTTNAIAVGISGSSGLAIEFRGAQAPRTRVFQTNSISELSTLWFDGRHGMAAGLGNNLLAYRNNAWVEENNPTLRRVMSLLGDAQGAFVVLNELGSIYRYDPVRRVWDSLYDRELAVLLTTGKVVDATTGEAWAVGGGRLWHFAGGGWTATNLPSNLATAQFTASDVFDHRLVLSGRRSNRALVAALDLRTLPAPVADAGVATPDAGASDAGETDAGTVDAGQLDAGELDGGGEADAGEVDAGTPGPSPVWAEFTLRGPQQPRGVFGGGPGSTTGFVVGDFGAVWEWDSTTATFIERSRGFYGDVADLAAIEGDVFVTVNECQDLGCSIKRGLVMHQATGGWEALGTQPWLGEAHAIVARNAQEVVVATTSGLFRWDGTQWLTVPTAVSGLIRDLKWCGALLVGAGDNGLVYTGTANQLASFSLPSASGSAWAVSCPSQTEIWVAGDAYLAQRVGMAWTVRESMDVTHGPWRTVYAPGGGEAWAYGDARWGVYWDGATLSALESFPVPIDVATASWAQSVDTLYLVGGTTAPVRFGFMMRFDGVQWRLIDSGSQRRVTALDGVATDGGTTLWLGTLGGGVLRSVQP